MKTKLLLASAALFAMCLTGCAAKENKTDYDEHDQHEAHEHSETLTLHLNSIRESGIKISPVSKSSLSGSLTISAKIISNQDYEALVGSFIEGRVKKVLANLGDYVKKGQTLMLIEGIEIGQIKAEFIRAKAEFEYAEANLKRQELLFDQKIGSQKSLLEARADYQKALAGLDAEDKRIHSIGISEEEMDSDEKNNHTSGILAIKAPIDGVIVERNVVIGELINPERNAFKILNNASLWVDGQIYEKDLQAISGKPSVQFKTASYGNDIFTGKLMYIGEVVESESRTIKVRAVINNHKGKLKPEMYGEMMIPVNKNITGIVVESESVVRENNSDYVFVAVNDTSFEKREVETGFTSGGKIEIVDGLKEDERIVSKGTFFLRGELHKDELEGHEH